LKTHVYTLKKSSVNKNRTFGDKIRSKIEFLGGEKETGGGERNLPLNILFETGPKQQAIRS
jgi:hypothetical protein